MNAIAKGVDGTLPASRLAHVTKSPRRANRIEIGQHMREQNSQSGIGDVAIYTLEPLRDEVAQQTQQT